MTRTRSQIRAEQHGQASSPTTAVPAQPGRRPFLPEDAERLQATLPGMLGATPTLACPSPIAILPSNCAPSSSVGPILLARHQPCPRCHAADLHRATQCLIRRATRGLRRNQ
jgi:hypothetical protein